MRIALLTDIHGNREALTACLAHADRQGVDRFVFLGDLVGYGADPCWVVETVQARVARGALALLGNHDEAVLRGRSALSETAATAAAWTRKQLGPGALAFLQALPLRIEEEGRLYVHADASAPERWRYVLDAEAARRSLEATTAHVTFCGHVHVPRLYALAGSGKPLVFCPIAGAAVPLLRSRRWLAVIGAVGQPRDGDPAACYALLDTAPCQLTCVRVRYDVAAAAAKIRPAGLPESLAARLAQGR